MFTDQKVDSIRALGEVELIAQIRDWLGDSVPPSPEGMGDDCAVIKTSKNTAHLLTTDSVSYGQHFDDSVSAHDAGAKLIKRNLSDIAAMGGHPGPALLNLLCGSDLLINWLHEFISGIREACEQYEVPLVGGDISSLPKGQFSAALSLTGSLEHPPLLRSGAQAGDSLYVTGSLGGSILQKHYKFDPRLAEGQWLAQSGVCSALMDITDGLAKDLRDVLPSRCAAELDLNRIPVSEDARRRAEATERSPMAHAFCDGEDYELLFTVKASTDTDAFESDWAAQFPKTRLSRIGQLGEAKGEALYLDAASGDALPWTKGFEHVG